ncbi:MAG: hypothetical protein ACK5Y2_13240 [Bdellovibrionales bacterium]
MRSQNRSLVDQRGFVLVFMGAILIMGLLVTMTLTSSLIVLHNKMQTVHLCRTKTLQIQKEVRPFAERLLSLNPVARTLRLAKIKVETKLALAIAAANKPAIAYYLIERQRIVSQQRQLDQLQKSILSHANLKLRLQSYQAQTELRRQLQELAQRQSAWATTAYQILAPKIPTLALRRTDRRIAPTYEPRENFEAFQAVRLSWIQHYKLRGWLQSTRWGTGLIHNECQATLEETTWQPKIRKARPSSK